MKIKLTEPKEDDPIFKSGFVFSQKKNLSLKKTSKSLNKKKEIKKEDENKKRGIKPPFMFQCTGSLQGGYPLSKALLLPSSFLLH